MSRIFSSNLKGKVRNFHLPYNRPLVPLYEAIVNSINAIDERKRSDTFKGRITVEVLRDDNLFPDSDAGSIKGFKIIDNGVGFNDANMESFMEADSDYKLDIGGKGVGRFSWLKAFKSASIRSTYKDSDSFITRTFIFSLENQAIEDRVETSSDEDYNTEIFLNGYNKNYEKYTPKQLKTIASRIIQHCFAYFLRTDCPEIIIFDKSDELSLNQLFNDGVNTEYDPVTFELGEQNFELRNIKITDKTLAKNSRLFLCANDRLVCSSDLEKKIINLDTNIYDREGYWYVGVLTSKYFDDNVDMNRLSFTIPAESDTLFPNLPGLNEIEVMVCEKIEVFLHEYLSYVSEEKQERIKRYTIEKAPQYRYLLHYVPDKIAALSPSLSEAGLDDALHSIKRDFENSARNECNELLKKLEKGEINSEEYQKQFQKTVEKVSDVNRAALADYVTHRRIILNLFDRGLNIKPDGKFNVEKYMHQLIYPMRATSDDIPYDAHNLWLIDEKLSFCQFISSDKPFDNAQGEERTDIMFLDAPVVVADSKNDGTAYNSIIIFELKRPMRNDYDMVHNPINQLYDYVKRIKSGEVKDSKHRPINITENTQFYLYALCDITPTLESVMDSMDFTRTPDRLGAYKYNNNLHAYIEVLSFNKVCNDAEKRNRVLFEKLGIN